MKALPRTVTGMMMLTLRIGLGGLFLYTGIAKALDPMSFSTNVRSFQILPDPWAAWVAMGLPWLEILAGAALVTGVLVEGALACIAGMLAVFLWAFIYSWQRGLDVSCGCFGDHDVDTDYTVSIAQDSLLLALTIALLIHQWFRKRRPRQAPEAQQ